MGHVQGEKGPFEGETVWPTGDRGIPLVWVLPMCQLQLSGVCIQRGPRSLRFLKDAFGLSASRGGLGQWQSQDQLLGLLTLSLGSFPSTLLGPICFQELQCFEGQR